MRINKFLAQATGVSRRAADTTIAEGRVTVNGSAAVAGQNIGEADVVAYGGTQYTFASIASLATVTIMLHKPAGYVVSRSGQGSATVYSLLPPEYYHLKPVGRLDKDSSGLLLLTNDGELANQLTHPSNHKVKIYEITLDHPLQPLHRQMINDHGIQLSDGLSRLQLDRPQDGQVSQDNRGGQRSSQQGNRNNRQNGQQDTHWQVTMHEGRNRQIRRTFAALDYTVTALHRTQFGPYSLDTLPPGEYRYVA